MDFGGAREAVESEFSERAEDRDAESQARGPAGQSDDQVLDDELASDLRMAGAERQASGELFGAGIGARESEVGDVQRADQKHEDGGGPQQIEGSAHIFDQ